MDIVHADVEVLSEGGQTVVAMASAGVVERNEASRRRAPRVRASRATAEHRASFRAGT